MSANAEIIAELRRVLNERDEAREQLDLTKRELGRWVDRETKAARELDEARERNTDLRKMLEQVTRERDLSLFAWESAGMTGRDAQSAMLELARQLEEARAIVGSCWLTYSEGERDKARAWAHQCERERDEARAEAKELREVLTLAGERLKACSYELTEFSYQEMASVLFDLPCNTEEPTDG
jgi:predicted  nucleic acid-binding Zn-ribbon protein